MPSPSASPPVSTVNVLVVARGFFEAFPADLPEERIRETLGLLGWDRLHEVAPRLGPFLASLVAKGREGSPVISAACPPANEWIGRHRPSLAASLAVDLSPAEVAFLAAAREAIALGVGARLAFVSPCRAKAVAMLSFARSLAERDGYAGLSFEVVGLEQVRNAVLARLGLPVEGPPPREAAPFLPPGVLFVEGEAGLAALAERDFPPGTRAILPFWCEGGCNGSAFEAQPASLPAV